MGEHKAKPRRGPEGTPLTENELSCCRELMECGNKTEAYERSTYNSENSSIKTIRRHAMEVFARPRVIAHMIELQEARNERTEISADYVLNRLVEIDKLDPIDIFADDGNLKPISLWPKAWRTSIVSFDVMTGPDGESTLTRIKLPDKLKNLEMIGKHNQVNAWNEALDNADKATVVNIIQIVGVEPERVVSEQ